MTSSARRGEQPRGRSTTCRVLIIFVTLGLEVLMSSWLAETVTVSLAAPISNGMVTAAVCVTETIMSRDTARLKPFASTVIVYLPGCRAGTSNAPCSLDSTLRAAPVAMLATVMVAPATTAPVGSVTVPLILPVVV
jgi:hypothetical protein